MPHPAGTGGGPGSDVLTEARPAPPAPEPREGGRFAPGTVVGGRYRIVALLGAGGMGEVYRADDVRLGQRVALKFLPAGLAGDPEALARLHAEVRVGREVSHPNVCRLYDVAEAASAHFISMEYVDGEDLASLLHRIGRLPGDKALAVAKGICAGLAAAHDRGILHRDIKPANVMIDGHGQPRVTDFGLAVPGADAERRPGFAGTPAYMAPEQLAGGAATARSDVYALGLVLYEMFTGRRLFDGGSVDEIRAQHAAAKRRPSSVVEGVDPEVERVILRCLEESPGARPPSVHAVLAALPGGDPLQAAVDAGETPSPEMVAAAGRTGDVSSARGWLLYGAFVLTVAAAVLARQTTVVEGYAPRPKPPEVLADHARELLHALAGAGEPADRTYGYVENRDWLAELARRSTALPVAELRAVPPAAILFQYRESPELLVAPVYPLQPEPAHEPPRAVPGTASVLLDAYGRLVALERVPPPASDRPPAACDWAPAFREAGLALEDFGPSAPRVTPAVGFDDQRAWEGTDTEPRRAVRVEAASHRGVPVSFRVVEPWDTLARGRNPVYAALGTKVFVVVNIVGFAAGLAFARRNLRLGRGDRRGAPRLAAFAGTVTLVMLAAAAHHVGDLVAEFCLAIELVAVSLFVAGEAWLGYLALEPYVRRRWPHMLVGLTRLVSGRLRDPLVGRELLVGALAGAAAATITALEPAGRALLGLPAEPLASALAGMPISSLGVLSVPAKSLYIAFHFTLGWLIVLVLLRHLVRRDRAAYLALWATAAGAVINSPQATVDFSWGLAGSAAFVYVLRRSGALALASAFFTCWALRLSPMTYDTSQFFAPRALALAVLLVAAGAFAFRVALGGKPLLGGVLAEEEAPAAR